MNGNVLLMTLVIAFEPIPVLAGVLLLTAKRGRRKALGFLAGWALALAIIGVLIVVVGGQVSTSSDTSSTTSALIDVGLGIAIAVLALRQRAKARQGESHATPKWMARIDTMSPWAAFGIGMFVPPYLLAAAVGNDIVRQALTQTQRIVAMVLYVVIGSLGILIPIGVTVVRPDRSDAVLASWRRWLEANWQMVAVWMLVGIGGYLVVKGIFELA